MEPAPVEVEGRRRERVEISHLKELDRKAGCSVGPSKLLEGARYQLATTKTDNAGTGSRFFGFSARFSNPPTRYTG